MLWVENCWSGDSDVTVGISGSSSGSVMDELSKEVSLCCLLVYACNASQGLFWFYYWNFWFRV